MFNTTWVLLSAVFDTSTEDSAEYRGIHEQYRKLVSILWLYNMIIYNTLYTVTASGRRGFDFDSKFM